MTSTAIGQRPARRRVSAPRSPSRTRHSPSSPKNTTTTTVKPQLPADFEEATWRELSEAVAAVLEKRPIAGGNGNDTAASPPPTLQALYRGVEDLCAHHAEERMYRRLMAQMDAHVARELERLDAHAATAGGGGGKADDTAIAAVDGKTNPTADQSALSSFLDKVDAFWTDLCAQVLLVRTIFLHLDRTYVVQRLPGGCRSLVDASLAALRQHLSATPSVRDRVVEGVLALVARERQGEPGDRALCASLCRMLAELGMHGEALQPPLVEATRRFYRAEGERLALAELAAPAYLAHCDARLAQEAERCASCLDAGTLAGGGWQREGQEEEG